jgi:flagellar biosynthetic protein FliR
MSLVTILMASASLFALSACRIAGFVVASPFPGQNVGRSQRVTLVVVLAWISTSLGSSGGVVGPLDLALAGSCATELGCGLLIGIAFRFVFSAAEVLGGALGQTSGIASAATMNPTLDSSDTVFGRLVGLGAMLLALGAGIHRIALRALLESFRVLPVGTVSLRTAPIFALVEVAIDAFSMGVRLATPVVAIALLTHLALALVARTSPSIQIFSVGFSVLFLVGVTTFVSCLRDMMMGLEVHFNSLSPVLDRVLSPMRP